MNISSTDRQSRQSSRKKFKFSTGSLIVMVLIGIFLFVLLAGPQNVLGRVMGAMMAPPGDLDMASTRLTDQGLFEVTYTSAVQPSPINQLHSWMLHVENSTGQPVEQAEISVDGGMPQHGHGLPTQPQVTKDLGNGDYLVEGMKFHMPGWWEVKFEVSSDGETDPVTFNLVLK